MLGEVQVLGRDELTFDAELSSQVVVLAVGLYLRRAMNKRRRLKLQQNLSDNSVVVKVEGHGIEGVTAKSSKLRDPSPLVVRKIQDQERLAAAAGSHRRRHPVSAHTARDICLGTVDDIMITITHSRC